MDKKIKVIHISHESHSYFSKDFKKLITGDWYALTGMQLKKYYPEIEVECWTPEKEYEKEKRFSIKGVKFRIFPTTFSPRYALDLSIPMLRALKKEAEECRKNGKKFIIHLHEYHNFHGLLIASFFKNEIIIGQHHGGSWPLKHLRETRSYRLFLPLFLAGQAWENLVLKNIKCFFALSQEEIDYLKGITNSEIKFQTMGIDEEYFLHQAKKSARKKLGLKNEKIIIYIGRINEIKGIRYLLDAMESLPEIELRLLGFGDVEKYRRYADEKKLKNVKFLGGVYDKEKLLYLSAADALVLPSSKEGAPVVIMEALARNLPVIATNVSGIPLMIKNNEDGIIIRERNSIDIINAVKKMLKWKKDVRSHAERYKWQGIIRQTVEEYKKLK